MNAKDYTLRFTVAGVNYIWEGSTTTIELDHSR